MAENCEMDLSIKLATLEEKGLISADEYQKMASSGQLVERELLKLIVSQYQLQRPNVLKIVEVLATEIPATVESENNPSLQNDGGNDRNINPLQETSKNPLLIDAVVAVIFEFLTLDAIKQCRLVCHQWNFTAQPLLRRKGMIHFRPKSLVPATFLEAFRDELPDLPFDSFKFSNEGSILPWLVSQLQIFFDEWGKNVKHLELMNVCLIEGQNTSDVNITSFLEKATNLTKLKINIKCEEGAPKYPLRLTRLEVELEKLQLVKYLHLQGCSVSICRSKSHIIKPLEIYLNQVNFTGTARQPVRLTKYINFSHASNVFLNPNSRQRFSLAHQELKAENVYFNDIRILNWNKGKGKINSITLFGTNLVERNELEIKKFILNSSTIDLAAIPLSIQQIHFEEGTKILGDHPVVLPELVFLSFRYIAQATIDMLSRFAPCNNLVEIEIEIHSRGRSHRYDDPLIVKTSLIPTSVKRMKIQGNINFVCDNHLHTLEKLIIQRDKVHTDFLANVTTMLSDAFELTVNVLVMHVSEGCFHWDRATDFVNLKQRFEKIVLGDLQHMYTYHKPFEGSSFSRCVDQQSDCYEFQTNVTTGRAISTSEFNSWTSLHTLQTS